MHAFMDAGGGLPGVPCMDQRCLWMGAFDAHLSFDQFWGKVQGRPDSRHGHVIILIEDSRNTQVTKLHLVIVPEKHINLVR